MTTLLVVLLVVFAVILVAGLIQGLAPRTPAVKVIENPEYDPEIVKFLVRAGLPADEIRETMEQRNLLK